MYNTHPLNDDGDIALSTHEEEAVIGEMVRWTDRHALGKESLLLLLLLVWRRRTSDDRARKKKERVRVSWCTYRRVVGSEGSPRSVWKIRPVVHFNIYNILQRYPPRLLFQRCMVLGAGRVLCLGICFPTDHMDGTGGSEVFSIPFGKNLVDLLLLLEINNNNK